MSAFVLFGETLRTAKLNTWLEHTLHLFETYDALVAVPQLFSRHHSRRVIS